MDIESDNPWREKRLGITHCTLLFVLLVTGLPAQVQALTPGLAPQQGQTTEAVPEKVEDYSLPPEIRQKAVEYARTRYEIYFLSVALSIGIYFLAWRSRFGVLLRNWAGRISRRHFVQALIFVPSFLVVVGLVELPLDYYSGFLVEHRFGLSTQGFASWIADWGKALAINSVFTVFLVWILYCIIRRSPRRWWFYFWLFTIPVTLGVILLQPLVVDPLFFKFTPLEDTQPVLTTRIESMLDRAGLDIPPARIFEMNASSKTKTVNAYVTGLGASKRLVIWDNTLKKLTPDETLLVVGHETGHYALQHIAKEFVLIELVSLVFIYLGFVTIRKLVARWGEPSRLEGVEDIASLPLLYLVLTIVSFLASPAICAISRHYEHQADQYGLELAYGTVPDPNAADARSFQVLGREDLSDPDPSPFIKFWLYTHPPLEERIRYALSYKPWEKGKSLEFIHKSE